MTKFKFWMVFVEGTDGPNHKYTSLESAKRGAEWLMQQQKGSVPVYVLEAVEVGTLQTAHWEVLVPGMEASP